jgi:aldehyde dehydrogenase (NAD+)
VFSDVAPDMDLFEGACFAPTLAITPAEDWEHALALQARIEQRLATSIFTRATVGARNIGEVDIFSLGSGSVVVNDVITPVAHPAAPIGGRGESGWGVTQGVEGLLAMTRAVHVARTGRFMRTTEIAADARTERRLKALARLLYGGRGRGRGVRGGIRGAGEDEGSGPGEAGEGPRPASRRGDKVEAHG